MQREVEAEPSRPAGIEFRHQQRVLLELAVIAQPLAVQERLKLARTKGKGWHDYKYLDPKTGKKMQKSSYIEVWDNLIFGAGIYKR